MSLTSTSHILIKGEESDEIETKKETLHKLCAKHAADHPKVFVCLMLETELIDHILKAAKGRVFTVKISRGDLVHLMAP